MEPLAKLVLDGPEVEVGCFDVFSTRTDAWHWLCHEAHELVGGECEHASPVALTFEAPRTRTWRPPNSSLSRPLTRRRTLVVASLLGNESRYAADAGLRFAIPPPAPCPGAPTGSLAGAAMADRRRRRPEALVVRSVDRSPAEWRLGCRTEADVSRQLIGIWPSATEVQLVADPGRLVARPFSCPSQSVGRSSSIAARSWPPASRRSPSAIWAAGASFPSRPAVRGPRWPSSRGHQPVARINVVRWGNCVSENSAKAREKTDSLGTSLFRSQPRSAAAPRR